MKNSYIPFVIESTDKGERSFDVYSRLLEDRIIMLCEPIDDRVSNSIIAQLLLLDNKDSKGNIYMYINTGGGIVTSGLAIYDTMQAIRPKIFTVCVGQAASMGAVLLAAGTEGCRGCLPNSRIMIHQPLGGAEGQAIDIRNQAAEITRLEDVLYEILAKHTKQKIDKIRKDCDRDNFMSAKQAVQYGIIDEIHTKIGP